MRPFFFCKRYENSDSTQSIVLALCALRKDKNSMKKFLSSGWRR